MKNDKKAICPVCKKEDSEYWINQYGKCFMCNHKEKEKTGNDREEKKAIEDGETEWLKDIVCPHCGHRFSDSWEYNEDLRRSESEIECGECGESFKCSLDIEVTYSTWKIKEEPCQKI